ncbi:2-methylaconitate cis-trans isomerase PrpF [Grimontia sp. NTOU-MAR1]|uniref:2-methylaconitate cis-trans isomerase PrpF n=1 Tax=Grimontia sp. NTOU-MAR1 TaxID=3111011 RepID=UPI002DB7F096|nr:2-methylaconitate cis-trans isomerase PrpF [Grimontia sp. NTOU-MAR1]WRV98045.1 2-methylaconitate cis-trans isomerase PrpF [Grimontia sp. NTOU-MAR1]
MSKKLKIPATYMRGGTSKGVFFRLTDLPVEAQSPGAVRDAILMRVIGSPDPYSKQIDGIGGATSSTSKTVIVSKSTRDNHDVDYLFGQVAIDKPFVDWSGNCGNLSAAVGPFAVHAGLIAKERMVDNGVISVRIWQANIGKTLVVDVPIRDGEVEESGDFELDGVTFPAAEVPVEFLHPAGAPGSLLLTGNLIDTLDVPDIGSFRASFINAGIPTIFLDASELGYEGTELQDDINNDAEVLERFEKIRAYGAIQMGLNQTVEEAQTRQHTPKIAFVSPPKSYQSSSGKKVEEAEIDVLVRALSMGKLHHAMMGTAAVAIAAAACVPGTIVNIAAGGGERENVVFGHPSGTLKVGAKAHLKPEGWWVEKATMSRSARILMEGRVHVPSSVLEVNERGES